MFFCMIIFAPNEYEQLAKWMKAGKKEPNNVWTILKFFFENLNNHHRNTIYILFLFFKNIFLYFQSCNYKIFMKIHHVSRVFLYV